MRMAQLAEEAVLAQRMVLELVGRPVLPVEGLAQAQMVQLGRHRLVGLAEVLQR